MPFSRSRFPSLVFAVLLTWASIRAGHADEPFSYPAAPSPADEAIAYSWLAGATVIPVTIGFLMASNPDRAGAGAAVFLAGISIGPSAGEFYADSPGLAVAAAVVRAAGALAFLAGSWSGCSDCIKATAETPPGDRAPDGGGDGHRPALMAAGAAAFCAGTLFSTVDTHYAVRRNHAAFGGRRAELFPLFHPIPGGTLAYGVGARLRF